MQRFLVFSSGLLVSIVLCAIFPVVPGMLAAPGMLAYLLSLTHHPHEQPLHLCVSPTLDAAASAFESGSYANALRDLDHIEPQSSSAYFEWHYLRALCLQSMGRFDEATVAYKIVADSSTLLGANARLGLKLAHSRQKVVPEEMIYFGPLRGLAI